MEVCIHACNIYFTTKLLYQAFYLVFMRSKGLHIALPMPPERNAEKNLTCGDTDEEEDDSSALIGSYAPILILL